MSTDPNTTPLPSGMLEAGQAIHARARVGLVVAPGSRLADDAIPHSALNMPRDREFERQFRAEQQLMSGIMAGALAALAGAVLWATISVVTYRQFAIIAIGIGVLVSWALCRFGNGVDLVFGIAGAGLSLFGVIAGNLMTIALFASKELSVSLGDVLLYMALNPDVAISALAEAFSPIDLLFYGVALYYGFKGSFRKVMDELPLTQSAVDRL